MKMTWGVVFDMDDTLYLERDYVRSGFHVVSAKIAAVLPEVSAQTLFEFLWSQFEAGTTENSFHRLLAAFPPVAEKFNVSDLNAAYRAHLPGIRPAQSAYTALERLRGAGARLGLISDGPLECQERKWSALGLDPLFDECVFTDWWGREYWKPHRLSYERVSGAFRLSPAQMIYVADNPVKDFVTPRCLGWHTVRLRMPGQLHFHEEARTSEVAADTQITCLEQLESLLAALDRLRLHTLREFAGESQLEADKW